MLSKFSMSNSLQESCPRVPQIFWLWELLGFQTHFSSSQTLKSLSDLFRSSSMCSEFASIQWMYIWRTVFFECGCSSTITRITERNAHWTTEAPRRQEHQSSPQMHTEVCTSCRYCDEGASVIHWLDEALIYLRSCDVSGGGVHITPLWLTDWVNEWLELRGVNSSCDETQRRTSY